MGLLLGGTITIEGKTYSISRIDSVFVERGFKRPLWTRSLASLFIIFLSIMGIGSASNTIAYLLGNNVPQSFFSSASWLCAWLVLCSSLVFAWEFSFARTYKLYFAMASTVKVVFVDVNRAKVESLRIDVVNGIERGYFPNYLRPNCIEAEIPQLIEAEWGVPVDSD